MSLTVSIARRDVYTSDGKFDTSVYEIQTNSDEEFIQDLQLETAAELVVLRDALTEYIERNNITTTDTNTEQQ